MTYIQPTFRHPQSPKNDLGYTRQFYEGALSTLCAGCGHDSISGAIVQACFELNIEPHRLAKLSGIGCSSKTPTYFLGNSHGFNSVHGRMPSVATGANMANRDLIYLGVSGDGDTASIGMGQFVHAIRRNLNMVYIVMNNGCYGLTKGQDSATADTGSAGKSGQANPFPTIDLAAMALELGATFVGRSFSGDKQQLIPMIKAAFSHKGFAFLDVISPCVTFNNTPNSTKSYSYVREHLETTGAVDYVQDAEEITVNYEEGALAEVEMHDGSRMLLHKQDAEWDPADHFSAYRRMYEARMKGEVLTGVLYASRGGKDLHEVLHTTEIPLNDLPQAVVCPGASVLDQINAAFR